MKFVKAVCADLDVPVQHLQSTSRRVEEAGGRWSPSPGHNREIRPPRPTKESPRKKKVPSPSGYRSISLDLTSDRYTLLDKAKGLINTHFPDNSNQTQKVFAFADVNCNLAVRFGVNNMKLFSNEMQLNKIFAGIQGHVAEQGSAPEQDD